MTFPPTKTDTLTELLWRIDPMGTCCSQGDDMADEYASQARDIAARLAQGEAPHAAVIAVFDEWNGPAANAECGMPPYLGRFAMK